MVLLSTKMYGLAWTKHLTTNAVSLVGERTENRHEKGKREVERDGLNEREGRTDGRKQSKQRLRKKEKSGILTLLGLSSLIVVLFLICWSPLECLSLQIIWNTSGPIGQKGFNGGSGKLPTSSLSDSRQTAEKEPWAYQVLPYSSLVPNSL